MTESGKAVMQQALDDLVESARLLGTTQAAKLCGTYSQIDSIFEHACQETIYAKKQIIFAAIAQPEQPASITHDDWYAKCNMVDALKDKVFALNAKCEVRDETIVNLRNAYAQAIAQPEQQADVSDSEVDAALQIYRHDMNYLRNSTRMRRTLEAFLLDRISKLVDLDPPKESPEGQELITLASLVIAHESQPEQTAPVFYQFQTKDGAWHAFSNEAHRKNTVEDGRWPIRALYTSPQVAQPEQTAAQSSETERVLRDALKKLLGQVNNIEVLGEWVATDSNITSERKLRAQVDAVISECRAVIAQPVTTPKETT